jgi:hypothetical protein
LAALGSDQIAALTVAQVQALTTSQIVSLTTAQVGSLTLPQVAALTTAQISAMQISDLAALTTAQIVALTTAQVQALTASQIYGLTTAQVAALETVDLAALTTAQIQAMQNSDLSALTSDQIPALTTDQIQALTTSQIKALTSDQIAALTSDQIAALETADVVALTSAQIGSIEAAAFAELNTAQLVVIDVADIAALTTDQLAALDMTQADAFTASQLAAMSTDQLAVLTTSPLILDLNGDGVKTLHWAANTHFDIDGDGDLDRTGWVGEGDGLLALDRNGDGSINNGSELFGNATTLADGSKAQDGFAALTELDSNQDGRIDANDEAFASLRVWMDGNRDGLSQDGELYSLSSLGIASINLDAANTSELNNGNWVGLSGSYETIDGQQHSIVDAWFRSGSSEQTIDLAALNPQSISEHSLSRINLGNDGGVASTLKLDAESIGHYGQTGLVDTSGLGASQPVQMLINGDANDSVQVAGSAEQWQAAGSVQVDGTSYDVYNDGEIQLLVASNVNTSFYS